MVNTNNNNNLVTGCQYLGTQLKPCGCARLAGKSYCAEHYPMIYQQGTAVRRKKDARRAEAVWDLESEMNAAVQELIDEGYDFAEERWSVEVEEADLG